MAQHGPTNMTFACTGVLLCLLLSVASGAHPYAYCIVLCFADNFGQVREGFLQRLAACTPTLSLLPAPAWLPAPVLLPGPLLTLPIALLPNRLAC